MSSKVLKPVRKQSVINDDKTVLSMDEKEKMLIISKVDHIYNSIKVEPDYFANIRYLIFFLGTISFALMWTQISMTFFSKNNVYCFDKYSNDFKVCDLLKLCYENDNGSQNPIFTNDMSLVNLDVLIETKNINSKYKEFFIKDFHLILLYFSTSYSYIVSD